MKTILIVDADSILYHAVLCSKELHESGFTQTMEEAIFRWDEKIHDIHNTLWEKYDVDPTEVYYIIGGSTNFRKFINRQYKSSRKKRETPPLFHQMKAYVSTLPNVYVSVGVEADDVIATMVCKKNAEDKIIVAGIDKDLKQIPSIYFFDYYYTRMSLDYISEQDSLRNYWTQILIGDTGDDVNKTKGIGVKTAEKLLKGVTTEFGYKRVVYSQFKKMWRHKAREKFIEHLMMLTLVTNAQTPFGYEVENNE